MTSPSQIQIGVPDLSRVAADVFVPESVRQHEKQVSARSRSLNREMAAFAAFAVGPAVNREAVHEHELISPLGETTLFSMFRKTVPSRHGTTQAIVLSGYRARRYGHQIRIGANENVCAYDFRFRPVPDARGKILAQRKDVTIRIGLALDAAIERVVKRVDREVPALIRPKVWAGFQRVPEIEDTRALRRAVLDMVGPSRRGPMGPSQLSPGGVVSDVIRTESEVVIGFAQPETASESDGRIPTQAAISLPGAAVLRPYVQQGMQIAAGAVLADFVPRRMYPNVAVLERLYGPEALDQLRSEALAAHMEVINGLICVPAEMVPGQMDRAVLYEDFRHLMARGEDGLYRAVPQVVRIGPNNNSLAVDMDGVIVADMTAIRPEWALS